MDLYDKTVAELQKTLDKLETPVAICSSQNEIIDQEQSWEYDVSIINAAMFASGYLSNHLNDDNFEWNRFVSDSSSFDDLNFRYKNNVFSVFIQIYYNGEELPIDYARKQKMLAIAKQNNHIPCVFPVNITDDMEEYRIWPAGGGANLFDLEMNTPLDPLKLASNKLVRRSKYDLLNGAIKTIWYHLEEQGFKPDYIYYDDPTLPADSVRLWFVDENNERCWVVVKIVKDKKFRKINVEKIIEKDELLRCHKGYIAPLIYQTKGKPIYRGVDVNVSVLKNIILKIHDAD